MATIYFIRHGQAARGWGDDLDPDLSQQGLSQAEQIAQTISDSISKVKIISSPMKRCQQTAAPLCEKWQTKPQITQAVSEIPTPDQLQLNQRSLWLHQIMAEKWRNLTYENSLNLWRRDLLDWVLHCSGDCVVFSHFVAINSLIGAALGDDLLMSRRPDYCSLWVFETDHARLSLRQEGREMESKIL